MSEPNGESGAQGDVTTRSGRQVGASRARCSWENGSATLMVGPPKPPPHPWEMFINFGFTTWWHGMGDSLWVVVPYTIGWYRVFGSKKKEVVVGP